MKVLYLIKRTTKDLIGQLHEEVSKYQHISNKGQNLYQENSVKFGNYTHKYEHIIHIWSYIT